MTSSQAERPSGLRERKKARTRDSIQQHALRLFAANGYAETTVEEIAEAAEVSPSTFFRYFPTKEDTVMYDRLDPVMIASFLGQPPEMRPLQAIRLAIRETFDQMTAEESDLEGLRHRIFYRVPALRSRLTERLVDTMWLMSDAVAERVGAERDDPRVRVFTGAVFGAMLATVYNVRAASEDEPPAVMSEDIVARVDAAFELLDGGLPFEHGDDH